MELPREEEGRIDGGIEGVSDGRRQAGSKIRNLGWRDAKREGERNLGAREVGY